MSSNKDIVQKVYECMESRDVNGLLGTMDSEIIVVQSKALPWGGHHTGITQAFEFMKNVSSHIQSRVTIERFVETGDQICAVGYTEGIVVANQNPFKCALVHVWSLRNDRITKLEVYIENEVMIAALK